MSEHSKSHQKVFQIMKIVTCKHLKEIHWKYFFLYTRFLFYILYTMFYLTQPVNIQIIYQFTCTWICPWVIASSSFSSSVVLKIYNTKQYLVITQNINCRAICLIILTLNTYLLNLINYRKWVIYSYLLKL